MATESELWRASEAHAYLSKARGAQRRIQTLADTISDLYTEIAGLKAVDYSVDRVNGSFASDLLESMLDDKDERMKECQKQAHECECTLRRIVYILGKMDEQLYASVLEDYYINGNEWHIVAEHVNYSVQHLHRIRFVALLDFYDCMFEKDTEIPSAIDS